jgi:DMSO/TMAO reductase YedYZ molybdopterin-dependent catalytic subunit
VPFNRAPEFTQTNQQEKVDSFTVRETTRRAFLSQCLAGGFGTFALGYPQAERNGRDGRLPGQLLGTVPLAYPDGPPLETLVGSGIDARLFTDLSTLTGESPVIPNNRFYVRTACPVAVPDVQEWSIRLGGLVRNLSVVSLASVRNAIRPQGTCLLECSGNTAAGHFGLMSAASWDGITVQTLLERARPDSRGKRILISGIDDPRQPSLVRTSIPGASWIFTADELERAGAFFATGMNESVLGWNHGAPLRLVVPGWYGCACIKWVNRIDFVDDDVTATSQMREFAVRTHQNGIPSLARDFLPATIDHAALPVRIEKWLVGGRLLYRVIGVLWGGSRPINDLWIRFDSRGPLVAVDNCPLPNVTKTWTVWTHDWRPDGPGRYEISLHIRAPDVRTRRLDGYFYSRTVEIAEV